MVRSFVGVSLPEELKNYVIRIQDVLRALPIGCKFVEPENFHICLSFLGDVTENVADKISKIDASEPFEVHISKIKLIPNENYFRVIVLGIVDETGMLNVLTKNILDVVGGNSKPPHLTLCRVRNVKDKESVIRGIKEIKTEDKSFLIDKIKVFKSELSRDGPIYSVLQEKEI